MRANRENLVLIEKPQGRLAYRSPVESDFLISRVPVSEAEFDRLCHPGAGGEDRFVPVLKQVAAPLVASVESDGTSGRKTTHDRRNRNIAGFEQQMERVGNECPGRTPRPRFRANTPQAKREIVAIPVASKDLPPLHAPCNDVVRRSKRIYSGLAWHDAVSNLRATRESGDTLRMRSER